MVFVYRLLEFDARRKVVRSVVMLWVWPAVCGVANGSFGMGGIDYGDEVEAGGRRTRTQCNRDRKGV